MNGSLVSRVLAGLILCSLTSMGCIITKDPSYTPAENTPPVVLSHPDRPMEQFTVINVLGDGDGADGGVPGPIEFVATIYDPDITQDLEGVVLFDYSPDRGENRPIINVIDIPPNGTTRREVRFEVQRATFDTPEARGCHVLELHVSERFANVVLDPIPASVETPPDLGRGIWWLHVRNNPEDTEILLGDCQR